MAAGSKSHFRSGRLRFLLVSVLISILLIVVLFFVNPPKPSPFVFTVF